MSMLSLALNKVDTSMPILCEGEHIVQVAAAALVDAKDGINQNLKIDFTTVNPETCTKGKPLNAGYKLTRYYPIPSDSRDPEKNENALKSLTLLALAVCGLPNNEEGKSQLPIFDESFILAMPGKQLSVKTKVVHDDTYGDKAEITSTKPILA
jgi:hypothetical protein